MEWVALEVMAGNGIKGKFHIPPNARTVIGSIVQKNAPLMFQADEDGKRLSTPPAFFFGGHENRIKISVVGKTGIETLQSQLIPITQGLQEKGGEPPRVNMMSGEYPEEMQLSEQLHWYRIPRFLVPSKSKLAKAMWAREDVTQMLADRIEELFRRRADELDIELPPGLVFGDVSCERTIPISHNGIYLPGFVNVRFRTNADLKLHHGTPWHLGKMTNCGYGVVLYGYGGRQ